MGVHEILLQGHRLKQTIDQSPGYEAKVTYLLLLVIIFTFLRVFSRPFYPNLIIGWVKVADNFDLFEAGGINDGNLGPGEFPEDRNAIDYEEAYDGAQEESIEQTAPSTLPDYDDEGDARDIAVQFIDQVRDQITTLKEKLERTTALLLNYKGAEKKAAELGARLQAAEEKLRHHEKRLEKQYKSSWAQTLSPAPTSQQYAVDSSKSLENALAECQRKHQVELDSRTAAMVRLRSEISSLKEQNAIKDDQIAQLSGEKEPADEGSASIGPDDDTVTRLNAQISIFELKIAHRDVRISDLEARIEEQRANQSIVTDGLSRTIAEHTSNIVRFEQDVTDKNNHIAKLSSELQTSDLTRDELQLAHHEYNAIQDKFEHTRQQMQWEIDNLRNGNLNVQADRRRLELEQDGIKFELLQTQEHNERLKAQIERLQTDPESRQKYEHEINRLNGDVSRLAAELYRSKRLNEAPDAELQRAITKLQSELGAERVERARAQKRFEDGLKRVEEAEKKVGELQKENNSVGENQRQTQVQMARAGMITPEQLQTRLREQERALKQRFDQQVTDSQRDLKQQVTDLQAASDSHQIEIAALRVESQALVDEKYTFEWGMNNQREAKEEQERIVQDLESKLQQNDRRLEGVRIGFETTRKMMSDKIAALEASLCAQVKADSRGGEREGESGGGGGHKRDLEAFSVDYEGHEVVRSQTTTHQQRVIRGINTTTSSTKPPSSNPFASLAQPPPPPSAEEQTPKRPSLGIQEDGADKSSLDYELFNGPVPDYELMVAQDEENARREQEEEEAELVAELEREM